MDVTIASLVTPAGVVVAAGIVTTLIQLIKGVFPPIDAKVSGALLAFIGTAVLYVFAATSLGVSSADQGFGYFLAWLSCATAAVGIKSTFDHATSAAQP